MLFIYQDNIYICHNLYSREKYIIYNTIAGVLSKTHVKHPCCKKKCIDYILKWPFMVIFSSPVQKYRKRKSYCTNPGIGFSVCVGISVNKNVKVLRQNF